MACIRALPAGTGEPWMRELKRNFPHKGDSLCQPLRPTFSLSLSLSHSLVFLSRFLSYRFRLSFFFLSSSLRHFLFPIASWYYDPLYHPHSTIRILLSAYNTLLPPRRLFNEAYPWEISFCLLVPATRYTLLASVVPLRWNFSRPSLSRFSFRISLRSCSS